MPGAGGQRRQQARSPPPPLPVVDHGHGDLGGLGDLGVVVGADIACGADRLAGGSVDGDDRIVVAVVDVDEVVEVCRGQLVEPCQEPAVARLPAEAPEAGRAAYAAASARSAGLSIFPIAFLGSSSITSMSTGRLYFASRSRQSSCRSSAVTSVPPRSDT